MKRKKIYRNILRLIEAGNYPAKIARLLDRSISTFVYCKKLEKLGYLRRTVRDKAVFYEITQAGKNFLVEGERVVGRHFRLYNFALKFLF